MRYVAPDSFGVAFIDLQQMGRKNAFIINRGIAAWYVVSGYCWSALQPDADPDRLIFNFAARPKFADTFFTWRGSVLTSASAVSFFACGGWCNDKRGCGVR
jgi:hypothetical protein